MRPQQWEHSERSMDCGEAQSPGRRSIAGGAQQVEHRLWRRLQPGQHMNKQVAGSGDDGVNEAHRLCDLTLGWTWVGIVWHRFGNVMGCKWHMRWTGPERGLAGRPWTLPTPSRGSPHCPEANKSLWDSRVLPDLQMPRQPYRLGHGP